MRSWVGAAALAMGLVGALACGHELDGLCTLEGCDGGARLSIHRVHPHANASYRFEVTTDRDTYAWTCDIVDGQWCEGSSRPEGAAVDDDDEVVFFTPDYARGDALLWILVGRDPWLVGPASFTLRITAGEQVLFEQSWTPTYERYERANSSHCGGCESWHETIEIDDAPARDGS
jgi:hypothetical protein